MNKLTADQIVFGEFYTVTTAVTGKIRAKVFKREGDSVYPFQISAAGFGVKVEEISK